MRRHKCSNNAGKISVNVFKCAVRCGKVGKSNNSENIIKVRGFNFRQAKAADAMEHSYMKHMVVSKMDYAGHCISPSKKARLMAKKAARFPDGVSLNIPQASILVKDTFARQLITQQSVKHYTNKTEGKRIYLYKTLQQMTRDNILRKKDAHFVTCMKYFTMPFGFDLSHVMLLKSKFDKIARTGRAAG